jgi:hypothetical protein
MHKRGREKLRRSLVFAGAAIIFASLAQAAAIPVDFIGGEIPTGPDSTFTISADLPALMGGNPDAGFEGYVGDLLFLKFKIPDIADVESIQSFTVSVSIFDNAQDRGESAQIDFAQPETNIVLADPAFTEVDGSTAGSPDIYTYTLTADQIAEIFPTIADGNFRVRIMRETGDFEVAGGSATIDATLASPSTPEPSSMILLAAGLFAIAGYRYTRSRVQ